ncbi:MAG: putative porin [Bacteroidota bacterium]
MNLRRILLPFLFILIQCTVSYAQQSDDGENQGGEGGEKAKKDEMSPDSAVVSFFSLNEQGAYTRSLVSKPLNQFQDYDVAKQNNQLYANLGNPGSASSALLYSLKTGPGFRFRSDVFEPYRLKDDSIKIYISQSPFSHVRYYMGPAKEQKLDLNFGQCIGSGLYLGLNARFSNAPGLYLRQRAYNAGGTFYAAFLYPTQRYGAIVTYRVDRSQNYESGGLTDMTYFTENRETNRKVIPVNLEEAMNRSRNNGLVFQQYFNILKSTVAKKMDTTTILVPRKFDAGRIVYTMRYSRTSTAYEDLSPLAANYPSYFYDTVPIFDSIQIRHFENCLVYSNEIPDTLGKSFPLQYSFGVRFQTDRLYRDTTMKDVFRQTVPFGMLKGIIKKKTFFKVSAYMVLGGYNGGDRSIDGSFYQFFGKQNHKAYLNIWKGSMHPDYYFTNYYTDYFKWDYSFGAQNYIKGEFGVILKGFDLNASYTRLSNYVFLNQHVIPQQYSDFLTVLSGHVSKEFKIKHWITTIYGAAQQVTPDSILQLPAFLGKLSICYDVVLFQKALHAQVGISGTYHSEWYQDAYMPALRAFYRQNTYISGNYPYLDAFINLNIKRARIFLKYEHLNAGLMNYNYILVPDYPQADAAFKFGISWLFFD